MNLEILTPSGPSGPLMIVGDYPTQVEWQNRKPFSGGTRSIFNLLLRPYKLNLDGIYSTYLVKRPIPGIDSRNKKVRDESWASAWGAHDWFSMLKNEIECVEPNVIIAFGEKTLNYLTGASKVLKRRGSILNIHPQISTKAIKVVPILSPRAIFQENDKPFQYTQWDIGKAIKYRNSKVPFKEPGLIWIVKSANELDRYWDRARDGEFLTFDIETHFGFFITCISFCTDGKEACSVPLLIGDMDYQERAYIYQKVGKILASRIPKVNQNIKYDWMQLERFGFQVNNIVGDTMLMAHTIYPEYPKGLDFLNSIYTEVPYYKDEGKDFDPKVHDYSRLMLYNAKDSLVTWNIWKSQQDDAQAQGVKNFFFDKVMPSFFVYKKMDQKGILVDDTRRKSLQVKYEEAYHNSILPLKLYSRRHDFNPESPKQVGEFIYSTLGVKPRYHQTPTGGMALSTDEKTLDDILIKDDLDPGRRKLLLSIKFCRKLENVLGFLNNPISADGRIRMSSKLHGTETGRTSMSKALESRFVINSKGRLEQVPCGWSFQTIGKHGFEWNGQTYGKDLRSIFVADPGYTIVSGDQKGAEARIVCVLSEDYETLSIMDESDIHTHTAALILGIPFEKVSSVQRQKIGKTGRHAGNYNESPPSLMLRTHMSYEDCVNILARFHQEVPKVRGIFHAQIREYVNRFKHLVSPHGRRRDFFGRINEDIYKEAFATIPQATVTDHSKHTILIPLDSKFTLEEAAPFCEAHDGLDFLVRNDVVEKFLLEFNQAMRTPIDFRSGSLPRDYELIMPGEYEIGTCWASPKGGGDMRTVQL
jgi:uracil-DNA glycosylase family 4